MCCTVNFKKFFVVFFMCLCLGVSGVVAYAEHVEIEELMRQAAQGNVFAQSLLGNYYADGNGVEQDDKKAVYYWELAAKQGYSEAQYNLGVTYSLGKGVPQDYKKAVYYWELAAEQGLAGAQYNLGIIYSNGHGVPQDDVKAYAHALIGAALDSSLKELKELLESDLTPSQREQVQALATKMWEELPK